MIVNQDAKLWAEAHYEMPWEKNGFLSPGNIKNSLAPIIKDERTVALYVF